MKIAMAQVLSSGDPAQNLEIVHEQSKAAVAQGARIVVFPEAMQVSFDNPLLPSAEPVDGPWANAVRQIAHELDITVVVGMFSPGEGERVRNTLLATGPQVDTHYDKIHLFDAFGFLESDTVTAGERPVQFTAEGVNIGLATCYDIRFPRLFTRLANNGADIILVAASWGAGLGKAEQWRTLAQARALDSTSFVIAVDQADPESVGQQVSGSAPLGVGHSVAVNPMGQVIAEAGAAPELVLVELDLSLLDEARKKLPVLKNAREL